MATYTLTFDADLRSAVREFVVTAQKVKDIEGGLKSVAKAAKDVGSEIERTGKVATVAAKQTYEEWAKAKHEFDTWRSSQKAFAEGMAEGAEAARASAERVAVLAKGQGVLGRETSGASAALSAVGTRMLQIAGPAALLHLGLRQVTSEMQRQYDQARQYAAALGDLAGQVQRFAKASGGNVVAGAAARKQADELATQFGLPRAAALSLVAKGQEEGIGDIGTLAAAQATLGIAAEPTLEAVARLNENLAPAQRMAPAQFLNLLLSTQKRSGAPVAQTMAALERLGPAAARIGAAPEELLALTGALTERTSRRQAVGAIGNLSDLLAGDIDAGKGQTLRLQSAGFGNRIAELRSRAPAVFEKLAANDESIAMILPLLAGGRLAADTRALRADAESGDPLRRAMRRAGADPGVRQTIEAGQAEAQKEIAFERRAMQEQRAATARTRLDAANERNKTGMADRLYQNAMLMPWYSTPEMRETFADRAAQAADEGRSSIAADAYDSFGRPIYEASNRTANEIDRQLWRLAQPGEFRRSGGFGLSQPTAEGQPNGMRGAMDEMVAELRAIRRNTQRSVGLRPRDADAQE